MGCARPSEALGTCWHWQVGMGSVLCSERARGSEGPDSISSTIHQLLYNQGRGDGLVGLLIGTPRAFRPIHFPHFKASIPSAAGRVVMKHEGLGRDKRGTAHL